MAGDGDVLGAEQAKLIQKLVGIPGNRVGTSGGIGAVHGVSQKDDLLTR